MVHVLGVLHANHPIRLALLRTFAAAVERWISVVGALLVVRIVPIFYDPDNLLAHAY